MTLDFYNLKEEPFGFLPDSRFLYLSSTHRLALAALLRALQAGRGFVTLLAQPDMGKTTLLFHTLNTLGDRVATVYLFQAPRTPVDLLRAVLTDLGVREIDENAEGMCSQLKLVLLEAHRVGRRVIVVIDEAQNLDTSILDLVCTLPNLATIGVKLIQFILCGQPLLADKLAAIRPIQAMELGAAAQLEPFSAQDTAQYVEHRLRTAGYNRQSPLFTPEAAALVAHYSQGTPRMINHLCFEALSTAYRYRRQQIEADTVHEAATALDLAQPKRKTIIDRPLQAPAAPQASVRDTFRPVPQAVALQPVASAETVVFARLSAPKTPGAPKDLEEERLTAAPQPPASPPVGAKKKTVPAPVGYPSAPALPTLAYKGNYLPDAPSQPVTWPWKAAKETVFGPLPVRTPARVQEEPKALPKASVLALPKRAATSESFIALQASPAAALQAKSGPIAVRSLVWRPLPGLTLVTALLLAVSGAVFGMYRAQTVHPSGKQTITASPLPHPSEPVAQRDQAPPIIGMEWKAALTATALDTNVAPVANPAPMHDIKGMDLQSALRALTTRKQRQRQNQTAESALKLH